MAKVSVMPEERARPVPLPRGYTGDGETLAYMAGDNDPLHLHRHRLRRDEALRVGPLDVDCVAFVWKGGVSAGGWPLAAGSSMVVEHGETLEISGVDDMSEVLTFTAANPGRQARSGGHVHILPGEQAPFYDEVLNDRPFGARMHADSMCPTCEVWLHENYMGGNPAPPTLEDKKRDIHSHSEDEIIFVMEGQMRLGAKLFGPGTALAVAADTFYNFTVGPAGLRFVNFRAAKPQDIRFPNGQTMNETAYFCERLNKPLAYLAPR